VEEEEDYEEYSRSSWARRQMEYASSKRLIHSICLLPCYMHLWAEGNTNQLSLRAGAGQTIEFIWIKPRQFVMGVPAWDMLAEAEWEYACRAGTTNTFFTGDDPASLRGYANVPDLSLRAQLREPADASTFPFDDGYPFTAPVGSFKPNPWGLYDMIGNVFQWCADQIPGPPPKQVLRGGCYNQNIELCRCAARGFAAPCGRYSYTGFRIVLAP